MKAISLDTELTGQRIHDVMKEHGYTVKRLQEKMDLICPHTVYKWIEGYRIPSTDNLYKLSKILGVSMENLLVETGTGNGVADGTDKTENETVDKME